MFNFWKKKTAVDKAYYSVNMSEYDKFIYLSVVSSELLDKCLDEYYGIYPESVDSIEYEEKGNHILLEFTKDVSFFDFHNLVMWLETGDSFGVMKHKTNDELSYYVYPDRNNEWMDTVIGNFNTKESVSVHLPGAFSDNGNLIKGTKNNEAKLLEDLLRKYN